MIKRKKINTEKVIFTTLNTAFLLLLALIMLYPMINIVAVSFNDPMDTVRGGITLWPRQFSLRNYAVVLSMGTIYDAFFISVIKTIITVITNLFFTAMLAYVLSRQEYIFNKPVTVIFVLTMYFNAGMIPNYMLMKDLHLLNTFAVYWVPGMISAFNLIVIRTYIRALPDSLVESARIDGAGEFRIFAQIITPLCLPTLATITLFVAVGSWNDWFSTFLYNPSKQELSTLQYELQKLLASSLMSGSSNSSGANAAAASGANTNVTPQSLRSAITVVTAIPILIVYPFLQRFFINGLMLGGVKE